jgi:hypothetical protein
VGLDWSTDLVAADILLVLWILRITFEARAKLR